MNKDPPINPPAFSLNTFAGNPPRHAMDRSEVSYCLASASVRTVPFATAQERTDELPFAVVAMDAIAAMEGHRELAIQPAFVDVVGGGLRDTTPTCQTSENVRKEAPKLDAGNPKEVTLHDVVILRRQVELSRPMCLTPDKWDCR